MYIETHIHTHTQKFIVRKDQVHYHLLEKFLLILKKVDDFR